MSNLYVVRDSDGYGHVVAANNDGEAVRAVQGALAADAKADGYHNGNDVPDGSVCQYLGTTDLVPSGTVLSGVSAAEQEDRANAAKSSTTTPAKK